MASNPQRIRRRALLAVAALLTVAYCAGMYLRIGRQARLDETRAADAIVIFGAAQYAGRPSPVLRARLDHGYSLYERSLAPLVITTGGDLDEGSTHSEGSVGRDYLISRGLPESRIIAETQSGSTIESARRVARIMKTNGLSSCIAVSDDYHIFRIKQMMAREGIHCFGAPRPQARPVSRMERFRLITREILSYTLWALRIT